MCIKISEDLTFSDWGGVSSSDQVAEEDFTLPKDKVKKTEDESQPKTKNIKFSRTSRAPNFSQAIRCKLWHNSSKSFHFMMKN